MYEYVRIKFGDAFFEKFLAKILLRASDIYTRTYLCI